MTPVPDGQGYDLTLADGQSWHIAATEDARAWLDGLARIMELSKCGSHGRKNIYVLRSSFLDPSVNDTINSDLIPAGLPRDGWKCITNIIETWYNDSCPDIILNLGPVYKPRPGNVHDVTLEQHELAQMSLSYYPYYKQTADAGGMPIHAGLVCRDGVAVLLAAPGGTGKSTCCRRIPPPWQAMSDDEALIIPTGTGSYHVHPFPTWSDYFYGRNERTWNSGSHLPLGGIFFVEQSPIDKAEPLMGGMAASKIFRSSMQAYNRCLVGMDIPTIRVNRANLFDNSCELAKKLPTFRLQVSLTGEFWKEIENVLPELRH
jgi:SynChlorMet cassette protein ScmC